MEEKILDQQVKNDIKTYGNIRKIATGQGDDFTSDCLLDYPSFKENYNIGIDLSKQQAPVLIQKQLNKLIFWKPTRIFFILEVVKKPHWIFREEP